MSRHSGNKKAEQEKRVYECVHCGEKAVILDADFDYADYDLEGEGIIHQCHCENCGAQITYYIPIKYGQDME